MSQFSAVARSILGDARFRTVLLIFGRIADIVSLMREDKTSDVVIFYMKSRHSVR